MSSNSNKLQVGALLLLIVIAGTIYYFRTSQSVSNSIPPEAKEIIQTSASQGSKTELSGRSNSTIAESSTQPEVPEELANSGDDSEKQEGASKPKSHKKPKARKTDNQNQDENSESEDTTESNSAPASLPKSDM